MYIVYVLVKKWAAKKLKRAAQEASQPGRERPVQQRLKQVLRLTQGFAVEGLDPIVFVQESDEFFLRCRSGTAIPLIRS